MTMPLPVPLSASECPSWRVLQTHAARMQGQSLRQLFAAEPGRASRFAVEAEGFYCDFSRQRIDAAVLAALTGLADELGLRERVAQMYAGEPINRSEQRAVLHTALRRPTDSPPLAVQGADVTALVNTERARMLDFAESVRTGRIAAPDGKPFSLVVNIGIGGSDLGPVMAVEALRHCQLPGPRIGFAANVDGNQLADLLAGADPAHTLFIVCSKTFTTQETRANADAARAWIGAQRGAAAVPAHFAAVSVNAAAMDAFGVHPDYRFAMWDWVGGRYSLWSSIGVSIAIAIGREQFQALLAGAHAMDRHFAAAPWSMNLPALAGLLGVWNVDFLGLPTLAILPYDSRLARLPAYLQQLEMESNGKSVRLDGSPVTVGTCPVIWGEPGNNAQHSFFQLLHQGTPRAALDFLLPVRSSSGVQAHQDLASANCLAQAEAFAYGQQGADIPAAKVHEGNRPSTVLMFERLDPATLGRLIALYEHKVFVQSVVWGINAFDQWGVELGKKLCSGLVPAIADPVAARAAAPGLGPLLSRLQRWR